MTITTALQVALNNAISSGKFIDTQIVLFSQKDSSGRVCKPKALYANSHVLKSVPYFRDLLSGPFSESKVKDFSETIDDGEFAEDYGYSSDSDLEEDWDFESPAPSKSRTQSLHQNVLHGQYNEHVRMGRVIRIRDVAFITFQAFLLYLYIESIKFAPFGSEENRKSRSSEISWTQDGEIPKPSPKSIYRLADKYDVPELKKLALENIKINLRKCDIVREAFSIFTSRYSEIMTMQVDLLLKIWLSGCEEESKTVREQLEEKLDSFATGKLDHAADTMLCVWDTSNKTESVSSSPPASPSLSARTSLVSIPFTGCDIRHSLVESIKDGNLLDRKFWARRSQCGAIEPIYFLSAVTSAELPGLDALLERHLGFEGRLNTNDGDEYIEDSDYEDETESMGTKIFNGEVCFEEKERKLLSVLRMGSSAAWKSLFFYLLTGKIWFAPLESQRPHGDRSIWVMGNTKPGSPAPCSPKTIYQLVKKLSWKNRSPWPILHKLALNDIGTKLTQENIAAETFSNFSARYPEVMMVEWKHLDTALKTEKTKASVRELIKGMKGGNASHRIDALKLGLYQALRRKGPAKNTLALLQCSTDKCRANTNPISFDRVGGKITCPEHRVSTPSMKCSQCGHIRTGHSNWCQGCRRLFE